jgi:peptide/nickel transport system permease protein
MMTTEAPPPPITQPSRAVGGSPRKDHIRIKRFLASKPAVAGAVILIVLLLLVVIGPFFLSNPNVSNILAKLQGHSSAHFFGTDDFGRDVLARVLLGGRASFIVAFGACIVAVAGGGILGIVAGYWRGPVDDVISRIFDILLAFPMLLLAIIILAALGPSLGAEIIAIGVSDFPRYGRLVRALTLEAKEREYVRSAVALGYSRRRILMRHIIPNIYTPVLVSATSNIGKYALAEAALSFLGIGVQLPQPSWGNMIAEGQPYLQIAPAIALVPGIAITLMTISFAFVGDGLRDAFDIREAGARS